MCVVFVTFLLSVAAADEQIVLQAFPSKKNGEPLSKADAAKAGILIKKVNGKYIWSSRRDKGLEIAYSGICRIFYSTEGSGLIVVEDTRAFSKDLRSTPSGLRYGEHIRGGVGVLSYEGDAEFFNP